MWRRLAAAKIHLGTLAPIRSAAPKSTAPETLRSSVALFARNLNTASGNVAKRPEDVIPIVTGHEREELAAELKGEDILEINYPAGPFGTKEEPAVIKSYYDKRIIGCPGADGEDEHDVVWFWLEKGKPHECPVCSQYFVLEVVGPGGPPDGHGDEEDSHGHGHGY